jgi:hypothetical protein
MRAARGAGDWAEGREELKRGTERLPNRNSGSNALETYRGVEYSVAKDVEGLWVWKLHPDTVRIGAVRSGKVRGMNKRTAVDAALQAIDKMLDSKKR